MKTIWRSVVTWVLLGFALSCQGHGLLSDDESESTQEALTPNGAIVATSTVAAGVTVGKTPGGFGVTADGQASYQIPIWTPAAGLGMQPTLALSYNSSAGSGPLGVGWSLGGFPISQITRCGKRIATDGVSGPVDFQGDTYCLDGQRLLPVSATEYRAERDGFTKVVRAGSATAPTGFTAWTKSGWILSYGSTANSILSGTQKNLTVDLNSGAAPTVQSSPAVTFAWALDTVKDRTNQISGLVANKLTVSYKTTPLTTTWRYSSTFEFKEFLIDRVDYSFGPAGTASRASVVFFYGQDRPDASMRFVSGLPIYSSKLLTRIEVSGPKPSFVGLLKYYSLSYTNGPVSGRPLLSSVKECDGGSSPVCKKPTTFTYEPGSNEYLDITDPTAAPAGTPIDPMTPFTIADVNGDGKHDVIYRTTNGSTTNPVGTYYYRLSNLGPESAGGASTTTPFAAPIRMGAGDLTLTQSATALETFDLDGDGRSEWSFFRSPGQRTGAVGVVATRDTYRFNGNFTLLPEPSGTTQNTTYDSLLSTPLFVADMDGDGLPETVESMSGPDYLRPPSEGSSTRYRPLLLRRNTNGSLGSRYTITTGSGTSQATWSIVDRPSWTASGGLPAGYHSYVADIDGSGRQAMLFHDAWFPTNATQKYVAVSNRMQAFYVNPTNGAIETKMTTLRPADRGPNGWHWVMSDVNGDGLTDALMVTNQTRPAAGDPPSTEEAVSETFYINTGAGFDGPYRGNIRPRTQPKFLLNSKQEAAVQVADMNQDGLPDIVLMGEVRQNGTAVRTTMQVLKALSGPNSATTGDHYDVGVAPTLLDAGTEIPVVQSLDTNKAGPMPARIGDFNGDGLMDIMAIPAANNPNRLFHTYIHQGKKADLLVNVRNGAAAEAKVETQVRYASIADPLVYQRGRFGVTVPGEAGEATWEHNSDCRYPLSCPRAGLWVVSGYGDASDRGITGSINQHSFEYAEARFDAKRGWLGFAQTVETDPHGGKTVSTFNNWFKFDSSYPLAFIPYKQGRIVQTAGAGNCDGCSAYQTLTTNIYNYLTTNATNGAKIFRTRLENSVVTSDYIPSLVLGNVNRDLPKVLLDPAVQRTPLSSVVANYTAFTAYDDPTDFTITYPTETLTVRDTYHPANTTDWLIGLLKQHEVTSVAASKTTKRTVGPIDYYTGTRLQSSVVYEALGGNDLKSTTTYTRGAGGLGQVTTTAVSATSTVDDPLSIDTNGDGVPDGRALSRSTSTVYDEIGVYPASVTVYNATTNINQTTNYAYHTGYGVLAQIQDPNGIISSFTYDGFGRPRSESTPKYPTIAYDYKLATTPSPMPSAVTTAFNTLTPDFEVQRTETSGPTTTVTYNQRGHKILNRTTGGDGQLIYQFTDYTAYDGEIASRSLPFRGSSAYRYESYLYDNLGRVTRRTLPDNKTIGFAYTPQNLKMATRTTNPRGFDSDIVADDRGRVVTSTEFAAGGAQTSTQYLYGPFGLPLQIFLPSVQSPTGSTPQANAVTAMTYDVLGRRIELFDADGGYSKRSYNAFGEVVKEVDAAGKTTFFTRDNLGRVTRSVNNGDPGANVYAWDPTNGKGFLGSSTSFDSVTKDYTYDTTARLSGVKWTVQGRAMQYQYTYDETLSRLDVLTYPSMGSQTLAVKYRYDAAGQINSVERNIAADAGATPQDKYWKVDHRTDDQRVDVETFGSGYKTTRTFNADRGWTDSIVTSIAGAPNIVDLNYNPSGRPRDANGNIIGRLDGVLGTNETFNYTQNDTLNQWQWVAPTPAYTTTFNPSPNGTMVGRQGSAGLASYTYDYLTPGDGTARTGGIHAVQSTTGAVQTMKYDALGNQTRTLAGANVAYNSFGLPKTISGTKSGVFTYDASGDRASKKILPEASPTTTLYAGGLYERRAISSGEVFHVFYIRGADRVVAQETWIEKPAGVFSRAPVLNLHDDVMGSIVAVSSATMGPYTSYRYDPYGMRIGATNPGAPVTQNPTNFFHAATNTFFTMNLGFTGHEMDDEFGLINMRGRIYDPKLGRFLSADPYIQAPFKPANHDRYAYVLNQPLKYTDPSGFMFGNPWVMAFDFGGDGIALMISIASGKFDRSSPTAAPGTSGTTIEPGRPGPSGGGKPGCVYCAKIPTTPEFGPKSTPSSPTSDRSGAKGDSPWSPESQMSGHVLPQGGDSVRGGGGGGADDSGSLRAPQLYGTPNPVAMQATGQALTNAVANAASEAMEAGSRLVSRIIGSRLILAVIPFVWATDGQSVPVPDVDATGKVHGEIPKVVPPGWTRQDREDAADALEKSLRTRQQEQLELGEDGPHRERMRQEEQLLRQLRR